MVLASDGVSVAVLSLLCLSSWFDGVGVLLCLSFWLEDELACAVPASPLPGHSEAVSVADRTAITAKSSNRYRGVLELPGEYLAIALLLYVDVDPGRSD